MSETAVEPIVASENGKHPLPKGWRWVTLGEACHFVNGDAYRESDWSRNGTPIIRIQNLNDPSKPFNYWPGPVDGRVVVQDGDLLLAWSGTPGTSFGAHIWRRGTGVLNQHIFRVDLTDPEVTPTWAQFAINHQLDFLIRKAHGGVGLRHVTKAEINSLAIPIPPLREQARITDVLHGRLGAVERARAAARAQVAAARKLAAAHLRALFSDLKAWPSMVLGEIGELLPAKSISTNADAEVLAVTTACLTETGFDVRGIKTARMRSTDVPQCTLRPGEILIARSNTPDLVGRVAVFPEMAQAAVASDLTIRLWCNDLALPQFISAYLSYLYLTGYWKERAGGASGTMKKITRPQILGLAVPLPARDEQRKTSEHLERKMGATLKFQSELQSQTGAIEKLPTALLKAAFAGEV